MQISTLSFVETLSTMKSLWSIFYFSPSDRANFFGYVSYHYRENLVVVHVYVTCLFLATSYFFSHAIYKINKFSNHFLEYEPSVFFIQIHFMMLEVIHGKRSRICVKILCLIRNYLFKSLLMKSTNYFASSNGFELGGEQ